MCCSAGGGEGFYWLLQEFTNFCHFEFVGQEAKGQKDGFLSRGACVLGPKRFSEVS